MRDDLVVMDELLRLKGYIPGGSWSGQPYGGLVRCYACRKEVKIIRTVYRKGDGVYRYADLCPRCFEEYLEVFREYLVAQELMKD